MQSKPKVVGANIFVDERQVKMFCKFGKELTALVELFKYELKTPKRRKINNVLNSKSIKK